MTMRHGSDQSSDLKLEGYFAHELVPVRDPMISLKEAFVRCSV